MTWYEKTIGECKEYVKDFRVINATEGGAKIEGTEIMTLREAIAETCTKEVDIASCLDNIQPMLNERNRAWAIEYLLSIPKQFETLKKETQKLHRCYCNLERLCKTATDRFTAVFKIVKKDKKSHY